MPGIPQRTTCFNSVEPVRVPYDRQRDNSKLRRSRDIPCPEVPTVRRPQFPNSFRSRRSFTDLLLLAEQASLTGECTKHPAESRWALVSSALERIFRGRLIEPFSRCPGRAPNPPIT